MTESSSDTGVSVSSGDVGGNTGGGGGDAFRSGRSPLTGVGARRGREGTRPSGVPGLDETDEDLVVFNGGRGGSGGNLDDDGTT